MREIHSKFFQWRKRQNSVGCAPDEEEEGKKKGKGRIEVRKNGAKEEAKTFSISQCLL